MTPNHVQPIGSSTDPIVGVLLDDRDDFADWLKKWKPAQVVSVGPDGGDGGCGGCGGCDRREDRA
jgi:hypothetical protein